MPRAAEEILNEALQLSEDDRDRIAESLWRSLHSDSRETVEESWTAEAERRCAEIDGGVAELGSWDETMARLKARYVR